MTPNPQHIACVCEKCDSSFAVLVVTEQDYSVEVPQEGTYTCPTCGHERPFFIGACARILESRVELGNVPGTRSLG